MLQTAPTDLSPFVDRLISHSPLSEAEQMKIKTLPGQILAVAPNTPLFELNEASNHVVYINDGLAGRFDQNAKADRQITALHIPGEIPNLQSIILPHAQVALQALSQTTLVTIPRDAICAVAASHPAIAEALWRDCVRSAMILSQWIVNLGCRNARCRIAHLMCEMAIRYKGQQLKGKVVYNWPVTQLQIADATGLTSIHVNRCLQSLKNDGVELRRGTVYIADWDRLVNAAKFDAAYLQ